MPVVRSANISEVKLIELDRHGDSRGFFMETWNKRALAALDFEAEFVQDNVALSEKAGTVRGLHLQLAPEALGKLVMVLRGAVFDVAVDVRPGSSTFGSHVSVEISAENACQIWVPPGFAHGYCTLSDDTLIAYKQTGFYRPELERGIRWNDPGLAIAWPVGGTAAVVSERDRRLPSFQDYAAEATA